MLYRDLEERQSVLGVQTQRLWTLQLHASYNRLLGCQSPKHLCFNTQASKNYYKANAAGKAEFVIDA